MDYFLMIFYFHICYMHMKSLFILKYINFKNYYSYYGKTITILLERNNYFSF